MVPEELAQLGLKDLAGGGVWDFCDSNDAVWQLPLRQPLAKKGGHGIVPGGCTCLGHGHEERPLAPARMRQPYDGGFGNVGMADGSILDRARADPLAARLDDILSAVDDLHVALGIDC